MNGNYLSTQNDYVPETELVSLSCQNRYLQTRDNQMSKCSGLIHRRLMGLTVVSQSQRTKFRANSTIDDIDSFNFCLYLSLFFFSQRRALFSTRLKVTDYQLLMTINQELEQCKKSYHQRMLLPFGFQDYNTKWSLNSLCLIISRILKMTEFQH